MLKDGGVVSPEILTSDRRGRTWHWLGAEVLDEAENVIILQHVPLNSPAASAWSMKDWDQDITLGKDGINKKDGTAEEIRRILTSSPSVKAILCGHLHRSVNDPEKGTIDHKLPQFLTAGGIMGMFDIHG